jgi:hypothetical protein
MRMPVLLQLLLLLSVAEVCGADHTLLYKRDKNKQYLPHKLSGLREYRKQS